MEKVRQSNLELLRIVSMLMVVLVHLDGASLGLPQPMGNLARLGAGDYWRLIVEAVTIIGVNCFTLISGYFGIRASFKGFCKFTFQCLFYAVGVYTVMAWVGVTQWSWAEWGRQWLVYSHTDLWYVPAYLGLYILSPMINAGIEQLSSKQFAGVLAGFAIFNLWLGWQWGGQFNPSGYTVVQLVFVYMIGRFIGLYCDFEALKRFHIKWSAFGAYLLFTAAIIVMSFYADTISTFAYNSPMVILSSVALFCCFAAMNFHSKIVNRLASGAFAVYLVHKHPILWGGVVYRLSIIAWSRYDLLTFTGFVLLIAVIIYLVAAIVDELRRYLQKLIFD